MPPPVSIRIGGTAQRPETIGVSPMNFGLFGHYTGGLAVRPYEIAVAPEQFVARAGNRIAEFVEDCKRDDSRYGGLEIPCVVSLGYPGISSLLDNPVCLAEIVTGYLAAETLWGLLGDATPDTPSYILNSLDSLTVKPAGILLSGRALETIA